MVLRDARLGEGQALALRWKADFCAARDKFSLPYAGKPISVRRGTALAYRFL